jgi:hypothetical protein
MSNILPRMEIISLCGCLVGFVEQVDDEAIKLASSDSSDGRQYSIPTDWVARIDESVYLSKDVFETKDGWKCGAAELASCGT